MRAHRYRGQQRFEIYFLIIHTRVHSCQIIFIRIHVVGFTYEFHRLIRGKNIYILFFSQLR